MKRFSVLLLFLFYETNIIYSQPHFELRNFYTNNPLKGQKIHVDKKVIVLDSLAQFTVSSLSDSIYLQFDNHSYNLSIKTTNLKDTGFYILYQFDKYLTIETSLYKQHKSWFGLVKRYTYEGGPSEEINKYDIFNNRNRLILNADNKAYDYTLNDRFREFLTLKIHDL